MADTAPASSASSTQALTRANPRVKAVLFDAYGTLFDVYSVALLAEQFFPGQGQAISVLWRDKQIEYSRLVTTSNGGEQYRPFWELTEAALTYALKKILGEKQFSDPATDTRGKMERLMNQYRHLSAFPENLEVLKAIKSQGIVTGILSNGDPQMLRVAVQSSGLTEWLDHIISVDSVRLYKTHPQAYALGELHTGVKPRDTLFVSCNGWDALAATWYGFQTLWVNRYNLPFEELGTPPTHQGSSLKDVLKVLS
jgi:2-haloacid dehalogenase